MGSSELDESTLLKIGKGMELRKESYGSFVFDRVHRKVVTLNEIAVKILELCDGSHTVGEIITMVKSENPGAESEFIENFMLDFLKKSVEEGLIEVIS
jgi:hypothetical protein